MERSLSWSNNFSAEEERPADFRATFYREEHPNRREVLGQALALGAVAVMKSLDSKELTEKESTQKTKVIPGGKERVSREEETDLESGEYNMGLLAGEKVGKLFSLYFDLQIGDTIPEKLKINFRNVLSNFWKRKIDVVSELEPRFVSSMRSAKEIYEKMYAHCCDRERQTISSLNKVMQLGDRVVSDLDANIAWQNFQRIPQYKRFTPEEVEIIRQFSQRIDGRTLLAYSHTELMPSAEDFQKNARVYDFILRSAGAELLLSIPSLGDKELSIGPFQFMQGAVRDYDGERNGASIINQLLPEGKKIPNSVTKLLTFESQLKAAQLFIINNLAQLMFRIRRNEEKKEARLNAFRNILASGDMSFILSFIASAHNNPNDAITAFVEVLDNGEDASLQDFVRHTREYIEKTFGNYKALEEFL